MARLVNRAVAAAIALTLLLGGLVVAVEIVVAGIGSDPWVLPHDRWYREGRTSAWSSPEARWLFLGLVAAGLLLLGLQLARRRTDALPLAGSQPHPAEVSRRSLERSLARTAQRVDGVASARASVSPARARVQAATNRRLVKDLEPRVAELTAARLRALGLSDTAVAVDVKARPER